MTKIGTAASRLLRSTALVTCSLGALLAAPAASQASGTITPEFGHLHPFFGHLHPFFGHLHPFSADVSLTYGDVTPFFGTVQPYFGHLHPFTAATDTASLAFYSASQSNDYWGPGVLNPFTWVPTGGTGKQVGPLNYVQYSQIGGFWTNETNTWLPLWQQWQTAQTNNTAKAGAAPSNAATDFKTLATSLQSFFFGASGTANTSTASLLTFWDKEITSQPKNATLTKVVAAQVYNILKPYGGVATINGNGVVTGIDLTDPKNVAALAQTTAGDQAQLYSNVYDRVMDFAGTDHVDWWQGAANWTPNLARIQMGGTAATTNYATLVGMIDYTVDSSGNHSGGSKGEQGADNGDGHGAVTNGHGAAVYSLIKGAPIDASKEPGCSLSQTSNNYCPGVAGVAQSNTYIFVYDPYDSTGSTSFLPDVTKSQYNVGDAIVSLVATVKDDDSQVKHPLGVINASLGVDGWTLNSGWNDALNYATSHGARNSYVLVVAAGNGDANGNGYVQTVNVPWTYATNPKLLIVGSLGSDGNISTFSNQPGEACLYDTASKNTASSPCVEGNKLKYRFIVAPGESILVSDGNGSTTRVTGTSLAAPLVTGTVALIEGRWNWLAPQYDRKTGLLTTGAPDVVSNIILQSATPLGTRAKTGVADPVYGMGALNITAANSPLNYNNLFYQTTSTIAGTTATNYASIATVKSTVAGGTQSTFNASNLYVSAFEYFDANANLIGPSATSVTSQTDTAAVKTAIATAVINKRYRDFQMPLSAALVGQRVGGTGVNFQDYLAAGLTTWASAKFTGTSVQNAGMAGFTQSSAPAGQVLGMDVRLKMTEAAPIYGYVESNTPIRTEMALIGRDQTVRLGFGSGAAALDSSNGFDSAKDYDVARGGANPLLGLASGGGFADYRTKLLNGVALNVGVTQRRDVRDANAFGMTSGLVSGASAYEANAEHIGVDLSLNQNVMVHTAVTVLRENTGLLGIQSVNQGDLRGGSTSKGVTLGFDWNVLQDVTLTASGTLANTRAAGGQSLMTGAGGINSSAGEIALSKFGLFSQTDRLRLTLTRPMQVDSGQIHYQTVAVVDRLTGELGVTDQSTSAATQKRPLSAEALYGVTLPRQSAEIQLFVRADANDYQATSPQPMNYTAGGRYRIAF